MAANLPPAPGGLSTSAGRFSEHRRRRFDGAVQTLEPIRPIWRPSIHENQLRVLMGDLGCDRHQVCIHSDELDRTRTRREHALQSELLLSRCLPHY